MRAVVLLVLVNYCRWHLQSMHYKDVVELVECGCCFWDNREEGLLGLWKGVTPNVGRNAIINAAELASYDTVSSPSFAVRGICSLQFLATWQSSVPMWLIDCSLMQIKTALISTGYFEDTIPCHLASGLGAGFFAVCFGSPVDVVKSRLMGECCVPINFWLRFPTASRLLNCQGMSHFAWAVAACKIKRLHKLPGLDKTSRSSWVG